MDSSPSRRRFLAASTVGLSTVAGCMNTEDSGDDTSGQNDGSSTPNERPNTPGVEFESGFNSQNAPEYEDWHNVKYHRHDDTRLFTIEVSKDGTVQVETTEPIKINREGHLAISYQRAGGSVNKTTTETLSPTDEFEEHTWEFEIPDPDTIPRNRKATVKLLYQDSHQFYQNVTNIFKEHNFAIIPYVFNEDEAFNPEGTYVINHESLNRNYSNNTLDEPDSIYTEVKDDINNWRLRFYVLTHNNSNNEFITGYSGLSSERYNNYLAASEPDSGWWVIEGGWHPGTITYNADDHVHLTTLADSFATSLDENGFTQRWTRLQKLAHLVGCIDSHEDLEKAPPIRTLWESTADCTEATSLFLALSNTETFGNTRGAMVACTLYGGSHAIVGIDERDVTVPNPTNANYISPSQNRLDKGIPDTRYVLVELTRPRTIGDINEADTTVENIMGTNRLHMSEQLKNPPYDEVN